MRLGVMSFLSHCDRSCLIDLPNHPGKPGWLSILKLVTLRALNVPSFDLGLRPRSKSHRWSFTFMLMLTVAGCLHARSEKNERNISITREKSQNGAEMRETLEKGILEKWYPLCVDTLYGGFLSNFDYKWEPGRSQNKMIVTQARHTWTAAQAARFYPSNELYPKVSAHGFKFLKDVMWDKEYGGFFDLVDREGTAITRNGGKYKKAYGNAFAIYGLAAYFEVSGDSAALKCAQETFNWLEKHSHDPEHGGYFQFMEQDGTPLVNGADNTPPKDQNSSIHLIEAFTELYRVWPDERLKSRIYELLLLIRDTITTERGTMNLFFRKDWSPVFYGDEEFTGNQDPHILDHISFGHDIETAFLLIEASETIGIEDDTLTLRAAKKMADHTLNNGWDPGTGALYYAGYYFENSDTITILMAHTDWWAAAEALNTSLIMADIYPDDSMKYYDKFTITWDYCKTNLIDQEYGGWYSLGLNIVPDARKRNKGGLWKGNYHNARSLINCIQRIEHSLQK